VHPERVSGLVLVAAAIYEGGTPAWLRPVLRTPQVRRLGPLISRSISKLGDRFLGSAWADPTRVSEETLALYRKPLRAENWDRALWEFTLASTGGDLAGREVELRMPVLVMTGDQDRIVPPASSQRLADALGVPLVTVADCGHLPQEEQPARFLDAVRPFLAELP